MAAFSFNCCDGSYSEIKLGAEKREEDVFLFEIDNRNLPASYVPSEKDEAEYWNGLLSIMLSPTTARRIARELISAADEAEKGI